jgi:hypothetical protein
MRETKDAKIKEIYTLAEYEKKRKETAGEQRQKNFLKKIAIPKDKRDHITDSILLENGKLIITCNNEKKRTGGVYEIDLNQEAEARPVDPIRLIHTD